MTLKHGTVHAEVDAMLKLPYQKKKKRISLAIYTTNRLGNTLCMSKCCQNCLKSIGIIAKRKNYIVNRIYYIDEKGMLSII
jgi:hypothetical protein